MLTIANKFTIDMKNLTTYIELVVETFNLAKTNKAKLRSKQDLAKAAREVHARARSVNSGLPLACEGTYLSACAQFEQQVRDLIEEAALQICAKVPSFSSLPLKMREAHTAGCAAVLGDLNRDKFPHLTDVIVTGNLHSCLVGPIIGGTYNIQVEAFSNNERNFRPQILSEHMGKLGLTRTWELLSQQTHLQQHFQLTSPSATQRFANERLKRIMDKRNIIVHRNRGFAAPTVSEVKECADYFAALALSMGHVLTDYVAGI